jgi:pilus assembly protein CpaF
MVAPTVEMVAPTVEMVAPTVEMSVPQTPVVQTNPVDDELNKMGVPEEIAKAYPNFKPKDFEEAQKLLELIISSESTEILMNSPHNILYKQGGQRIETDIKFSSTEAYHDFINNFILENTDATERLNSETKSYLIEGQFTYEEEDGKPPLLARVHILAPPVSPEAKVTIAKKSRNILKLSQMVANNTMSPQMAEFLKAIAKGRVTTIFSGLSGSGKTTLLETLSQEFDINDRIIVVEDTPELRLPVNDVVYLHSTPVKPGSDPREAITLEWLVSSTNRMRPDRIIVGECRGGEMAEFLIAANSGADGSMTTMHASTPKLTLDKIVSLSMKNSTSKSELSIARDVASTLQLIVQTALIEGRHIITHIEEVTRVIRKETGAIATQTLFEYDRNRDVFVPKGRPTDELKLFLAQRGVALEDSWFRGI